MAAQITSVLTKLLIIQECQIIVKITGLNSHNHRTIETPGFFPLHNSSAEFRFEVLYQTIKRPDENYYDYDVLRLSLIKIPNYTIPTSLNMDVYVTMFYPDGVLFEKYKPLFSINVADMDTIRFEDVFAPLRWFYIFNSDHYNMMRKRTLILQCYFHFHVSGSNLESSHERKMQSLGNLQKFNQELSHFYKSEFEFDVSFRVSNEVLFAHKFILSAHSSVFKKMLSGPIGVMKTIDKLLYSVSSETFQCFLNYMYSGEIEDKSWPTIKDLYILANEYEVRTLKRECASLIASYLSFDQVCGILKLAYVYGDKELKQISKQYAITHYRKLISKKEWKELITSYPKIGHEIMNDVILESQCEVK